MWWYWLILFIVVVLLVHVVLPMNYHWPSYIATISKVPGPDTVPILGTKLTIGLQNDGFLSMVIKFANEYSPIVRISMLGNYMVLVTNVDDAEVIMNSKSHIMKSDDYKLLEPWLGTGLLTSTGEKWFNHRKMLTPAFHFGILEPYIEVFSKNSKILIDAIKSHGDRTIDINPLVSMCTLDIICETAMGTPVHAQAGGEKSYVKAALEISELFQKRQLRPWIYNPLTFALSSLGRQQKRTLKTLHGFTRKVIKERRAMFKETQLKGGEDDIITDDFYGKRKRRSFLDLLVELAETEGILSEDEIAEEVDTFMFEGHDTTSAAISWTLFELGLNPEIQQKVQEEIDDIYGDSDRESTSGDLAQMKYLERVLKETLRIYPSVPMIARHLEQDTVLSGYTIPAGTNVGIAIYNIHHDPNLYPQPDVFDPDRFLPSKITKRHPFSYIPFSAGPRNCIGQKFALMEEKVVVSEVLRYLNVTSITKREEVNLMAELVLRPKKPIQLSFTPTTKVPATPQTQTSS